MDIERSNAYARHAFKEKRDPLSGLTDEELVKSGRATTKACKRWV
jgi:hypothetical protein